MNLATILGCFDDLLPFPVSMERANERPAIRHDSLTHSPIIDKIAIEEPLNTSSNRPDRTLYGSLMRTPSQFKQILIFSNIGNYFVDYFRFYCIIWH